LLNTILANNLNFAISNNGVRCVKKAEGRRQRAKAVFIAVTHGTRARCKEGRRQRAKAVCLLPSAFLVQITPFAQTAKNRKSPRFTDTIGSRQY